jgi:hypothetical protein
MITFCTVNRAFHVSEINLKIYILLFLWLFNDWLKRMENRGKILGWISNLPVLNMRVYPKVSGLCR